MTVICPSIRTRGFVYLFFSAAVTITGAARAQEFPAVDISDPNVTVDLSVLDDNGLLNNGGGGTPGGLLTRPGGFRLLTPGVRPPRSKLYIRPQGMAKKGMAKKSALKLPFHATAKKTVRKKPPIKKTKPAAAIAMKAPPKTPPKQITAAPPPPPALKPMKAETKATAKKKPKRTAAIAPRKLVPAPEVKKAPKKETKKKAVKVKSGPPKAVAEIPAPAATKVKAPKKPGKPIKKAEVRKETASLPPPQATPAQGTALKVVFAATASKLPTMVKAKLNDLAVMMKKKEELRIQLLAYAGGKSLSSSKARRLSLSRALSVRSYLIGKGIRSTRIDVRALGNKTTEEPLNRVDVNVITR